MTIYEIKRLTEHTSPHYFTHNTLKFFNQTLKDFKVYKQSDGRFLISAPMFNHSGTTVGTSKRYFNPENNKLELS